MTTVKTFEVGEMTCRDDSTGEQALLIGCGNHTIISLVFDNKKASQPHVHELERTLRKMGFTSVEVQTEEPRRMIQTMRRRVRPRPGRTY